MTRSLCTALAWAVWMACSVANSVAADAPGPDNTDELRLTLRVDFGSDSGQAYGTLWEATSPDGTAMAGAGFLNAYNTQDRSDRRMLHIFVRTAGEDRFTTERLPRPTSDAGTYLFGFDGRLFSKGRSAIDGQLRVWQPESNSWQADHDTIPFGVHVGGRVLAATPRAITYAGKTVLELPAAQGDWGEWYYAAGQLLVRRHHATAEPAVNELRAYAWQPGHPATLDWSSGVVLPLSTPSEFIYAFGQHAGELLAASNVGGVHVFDGLRYRTLRAPDGTSFQIYATLSTSDRLLLGQYPTGELFEFAGQELQHLPAWPPVMPSVSRRAREAQTLAIYGGDVYVGVWPWGEVWRQSGLDRQWRFLGRLFSHPEPTDATTHPYEKETKQLDPVLNRWGQRVTSMVPMDDALYFSTSSKGPNPYEPKFAFLDGEKHLEYGAVHRYRRPGCLAVPLEWTAGPTSLEFRITSTWMEVWQDGRKVGASQWDAEHLARLNPLQIRTGAGTYGPFRGVAVELVDWASGAGETRSSQRFHGAYVHLHRHLGAEQHAERQQAIVVGLLDRMQQFGLSAVLPFVTTSSGQAAYASELLERMYPEADPVAFMARESAARGLDFYPVIPLLVSGGDEPAGILAQHPEWALRHADGRPSGYISPALPEARAWLVRLVDEVVSKYQPAGVVLDYVRFANRPLRLDAASEERFRESLPPDCPPDEERKRLQAFKEAELTELVRLISNTVRARQPHLQLAAYVWGPHVAQDHLIAQVWPRWVEHGYLDMVNVSGYCHRETYGDRFLEVFEERLKASRELNQALPRPARLTFALGVHTSHGRVQSADDIRAYVDIARRLGFDGAAHFTWEYLQPYLPELEGLSP